MTDGNCLRSGATIGILGGGQLGRMLALAAAQLGMKTHIFCPDPESPAFDVTPLKTIAAYDDKQALRNFAESVDVITYEFENVPVETAGLLENLRPVAPGPHPLAISQDRLAEKAFLTETGISVAPYRPVDTRDDLNDALSAIGPHAVLKTTRLGYDGKGQRMIRNAGDAEAAFADLQGQPLVLEALIPFEKEISVIVARNARGETASYDPAENVHVNHILKTSTVPADIDAATAYAAREVAAQIANALDYIGVLGVEFFVTDAPSGQNLLVNEIAPRVHNSGHWTQGVCVTDQFEQHIRAICGWPLGDPVRMADVVMENLIGDEVHDVIAKLGPQVQPHIYGKREARPGRKMGHINRIMLKGRKN